MSTPLILRDEFGLPVKASTISIVSRDADGFPVRNLQRTLSQTTSSETQAPRPTSLPINPTKVKTVQDEARFPQKKILLNSVELSYQNKAVPLERASSAPSFQHEKAKGLYRLMNKHYISVQNNAIDDVISGPEYSASHPDNAEARRERSTDLSDVLKRMDSHLADHGDGNNIVCHNDGDDYVLKKFYARNQGRCGRTSI